MTKPYQRQPQPTYRQGPPPPADAQQHLHQGHPCYCDVYAGGSINRSASLHLWLTYAPVPAVIGRLRSPAGMAR
jgi:hypothetical protein